MCARGDGIRRSKDLRAEIGKFPNSTNERKQMSTKTLRKRISLVAVSALGAGLLSVVPANATDVAATLATTNGAAAVTTLSSERSVGLVTSTTNAGGGSALTGTATLLSTGTLVVKITAASTTKYSALGVTGGTITGATATTAASHTTNVTGTYIYGTVADEDLSVAVKFASGSTSMTVAVYENAAASTTSGTLRAQWVVTSAASSTAGTYSATGSKVNIVDASVTGDIDRVNGIDNADGAEIANGGIGYINYSLRDAFGTVLSNTGAIVISASGGALVKRGALGATTGAASITNITDVTNSSEGSIAVKQLTANAPANTTITISYNGVVVATKSIVIQGQVATITASSPVIAQLGASNADAFRLEYADAAGNRLIPSDQTSATTVDSATLNTVVTGASIATASTDAPAAAKGTVVCGGTASTGSGAGSANLRMQYVNASGTIVYSNVWTQKCAGNAFSYTAGFDKAVYAPGSIATLTLTFKDKAGNLANSYQAVSGDAAVITVDGSTSATAITAPSSSATATLKDYAGARSVDAEGVKTYRWITDTTLRTAAALVNVPQVVTNSGGVQQKVTVAYTVANPNATVTNEDILKSIVSLIASINKQIQALQKLILRR